MNILLIGGGGFIGPPLARRLASEGCAVSVLRRSPPTGVAPAGMETLAGDRADADGLRAVVEERRIEVVVDLIGYTLAQTAPVLDALAGRVRRYVFISSADVYRNYGGLHRRETPPPILTALKEDAPLRDSRFPYRQDPRRTGDDPERWMDDYDKIPIEQAVRAAGGFDPVIVRLPMVYGPGDKQRRFAWLIRPMGERRAHIEVDREWADWRTTYGFVDDVAAGIAAAATHPSAARRTFNLGGEAVAHTVWAERFAQALDWPGDLRRVDRDVAPMAQVLATLDLRYPLALDTSRIRGELGYVEPTGLEAALQATIEDELARASAGRPAKPEAAES